MYAFGDRPLLVAALLVGACTPALRVEDLPLTPARLAVLRAQTAKQRGQDRALRDRGWLELLYGTGPREALRLFDRALARGHDTLALLGRALALEARDPAARRAAAWLDLLAACRASHEPICPAVIRLALGSLAGSSAEVAPAWLARQLEPLAQHGPYWQRDLALRMLHRLARRAGDEGRLRRVQALRGCPHVWRVSGPWHRNPHVDLHRPVAHDVNARQVVPGGCRLELRSGRRWGGLYWATTDVMLPRERELVLTVEFDGPWQAVLDGEVIWTRGETGRRAPGRQALRLGLSAGRHRLGVKLGTSSGYVSAAVSLVPTRDAEPAVSFVAPRGRSPSGRRVTVERQTCGDPVPELGQVWYAPLARYLDAVASWQCRDLDAAHRDLRRSRSWAPGFADPHLLAVRALDDDPLVPRSVAEDEALRVLNLLVKRDPNHAGALFALADLFLRQGRADRALQLFRAGAALWPGEPRWQDGLHRVHRERSHPTEEERALEQAVELAPRRCRLLEQLAALKRNRKDVGAQLRLVLAARNCDAASPLFARFLRDAGDLERAALEYRRVLRLRPVGYLRRELVQTLQAMGQGAEARRELGRILSTHPGAVEDHIEMADLLAAGGQHGSSVRVLRAAVDRMPWEAELRRALERMTGRSVMSAHRLDGRKVIAEFLRRGRRYSAPAVVVQDRLVTRFHRDGSSISLTHNIVQVLTKRGIDKWGEVDLPEGAVLLTLRTVKRDGTLLEPEEVTGKRTISLPGLEQGDFVEVEYVEASPPARAFAGGLAERFYFASFDVPLVRSEYLALAPRALRLQVDDRGGAPSPTRSTRDEMVRLHWVVRDRPRLVAEPHAAPADEFVPSVRVMARASWEGWRDHYLEQSLEATRRSWLTERVLRRIVAGRRGKEELARWIYRWTVREIEAAGTLFSSATDTLASARGSRPVVLASLLRQAGIAAELWLVRPRTAARGEDGIPDVTGFTRLLVRCELGEETIFLQPDHRFVPFGYVSPVLRGALALRLTPGGRALVHVPERGAADRRSIVLSIELTEDGAARVRAVERLEGLWAMQWRRQLEHTDGSRLDHLFEQRYLGASFPGASLERLRVGAARNSAVPLRLAYDFRAPNLCRRQQGTLRCPASFNGPELMRRYVGVAHRRHPLMVGLHPVTNVVVKVVPPAGFVRRSAPRPMRLRSAFGGLTRGEVRTVRGAAVQRTAVRVVQRRVAPARFAAFARFARRVDRAFEEEMVFGPRAGGL